MNVLVESVMRKYREGTKSDIYTDAEVPSRAALTPTLVGLLLGRSLIVGGRFEGVLRKPNNCMPHQGSCETMKRGRRRERQPKT